MSPPKKKCIDNCPLIGENGAIVGGKKYSIRELLGIVFIAFLGGNTSGGMILGGWDVKGTSQSLLRIERKVEVLERKLSTFRVELHDLKIDLKLREKK